MRVFEGGTANEAWLSAVSAFRDGTQEVAAHSGRGGRTREILHAAFVIRQPLDRLIVAREPAMNPAFAVAEVIWILQGRRDSHFVNHWNPALPRFAGTEATYHGAYGERIRHRFGIDQLERACEALSGNPASRQVVLQIYDPAADLPKRDGSPAALDIPCNVCSLLKLREGKLHWTQVMRSNDLVLGFPHNVVQFTYLQELMASWLGTELGPYTHLSDSLHVYERDLGRVDRAVEMIPEENTDRWCEPYDRCRTILAEVSRRMDDMIGVGSRKDLALISEAQHLPEAGQNILRLTAADSARRSGWVTLAEDLMRSCSNPSFRQAWERWSARVAHQQVAEDRT